MGKQPLKLYVAASQIHGDGLFTESVIPANTKLFVIADLKRHHEKKDWISKNGKLINHQKRSNTHLEREGNQVFLYSSRDIEIGEELTSDYSRLPPPFINNVNGFIELQPQNNSETDDETED